MCKGVKITLYIRYQIIFYFFTIQWKNAICKIYKEHKCIICRIDKPVKLLQYAHLNPHCDIDDTTKCNYNIVEFMCLECYKLYDNGDVSINNGYLAVKDINEYPQYEDLQNKKIECYNK